MAIAKKTPRILAAAKEFNIGKDTLLDFLKEKGFETDDLKPTSKLSSEMYEALQTEFAQDKAAKKKSDSIDLPKGEILKNLNKSKEELKLPQVEATPSKEEVAPVLEPSEKSKPEEVAKATEEDVTTSEPTVTEEKAEVAAKSAKPIKAKETEEEVVPKEAVKEEVKEENKAEKVTAPQEEKQEDTPTKETDSPKETPKAEEKAGEIKPNDSEKEATESGAQLEGPKVVGKIDLDEVKLTSRPKKKKAEEKTKKEAASSTSHKKEATKATKNETTPAPAIPSKVMPKQEVAKEKEEATPEGPEHIETNTPKLEGTRVVGKIDLPAGDNKRGSHKKRKRKRIPVDNSHRNTKGVDVKNNKTKSRTRKQRKHQEPQEIDAKEIQEKIKETQAKLAGNTTRGRNLKAKYRKTKREERAEKRAAADLENDEKVIQVTEFISVSELANMLDVSFADVISKCMSLGIMVSINQRLDAEVIELVASEFDTEVEFIDLKSDLDEEEEEEIDAEEDLEPRAPVITIMGHVDHGKTSLLDYIRNSSVAGGEAGGITQHIGAYRVTTKSGKELTFLDTPGHEAFTAMRARGAKAADVAIIVIAADDAIMPQTKEAISHAKAADLPMVFAINKIDKEAANPEKIKEQLATMNILVEDWGGDYQSQEISAKKGINIDELLEKVVLQADLLELKANPNKPASGTVIEASLDKGRGYTATMIINSGTLRNGDMIVCGQYFGKVKAMNNERGHRIESAGPSTPVQVLGLNGAPQAGERLRVYEDESEAKSIATYRAQILREQDLRSRKHITLDEIGRRLSLGNFKELNVIIKADFDGSAEALSDSLQKLSTEEIVVNIIHKGVGQIHESDIMLASASDAIIIGFQVRPSAQAAHLADEENIEIRLYSIIYDAIEEIKSAMEGMLEPKIEKQVVGNIEVRETFKISGVGTIAGCYVLDGKVTRNTHVNLIREGIVVYTGELASLKRFKDDVKEVSAGYECGLSIKNYNDIQVGDILEGYEEVAVKRTL